MPIWLKLGLVAVVVITVLYVLISPLPEPDAAGSIRSILPSGTFALFGTMFVALQFFSPFLATLPPSSVDDILKKNCARLC